MDLDRCLDCPLWGHTEGCPSHWDGCRDTCESLGIRGVRHAVMESAAHSRPSPEDTVEFRGLLDRARILGNLLGTSARVHPSNYHRFLRYRGLLKIVPKQDESSEWFFGSGAREEILLRYTGHTDLTLHYESKAFQSGSRYAGSVASCGLSSVFADIEVAHRANSPGYSQGLAVATVQWYNHVNPSGAVHPDLDGKFFWQGTIPLVGYAGAENGFSLSGGTVHERTYIETSVEVLF